MSCICVCVVGGGGAPPHYYHRYGTYTYCITKTPHQKGQYGVITVHLLPPPATSSTPHLHVCMHTAHYSSFDGRQLEYSEREGMCCEESMQ